ncbi:MULTISPECIES: ester cyclase [Haloferax]|uniref:Ester cyclase n=1 Tax=Haloferax marinum TaxID=2666143 RepID=A0A6A8G7B0_9EURY|nr:MULTISPECIES: ester cyclase [Haloferax]KAB1197674.1 ester cyclase [Haloferax sp. CBA1150]MRW96727.1 ester cyclase [Haloferax marinum]
MEPIPTPEMKATIRHVEEKMWNNRDPAAFDEMATEDYAMHDPMGDHDLEGFKGIVQAALDGAPDLEFTIDDMFAAGDRVAVRYTLEGTNEAPSYLTTEPTGNHWRSSGISIYRFEGDKIAEQWDAFDYYGTMRQLGLIPSAAPTEAEGGTGAEV